MEDYGQTDDKQIGIRKISTVIRLAELIKTSFYADSLCHIDQYVWTSLFMLVYLYDL